MQEGTSASENDDIPIQMCSSECVGKSLVQAMTDKYSDHDLSDSFCEIFVPASAPGKTDSGCFIIPENLSLQDCGISMAGSAEDITKHCRHVKELDLTQNNLKSLEEVFGIVDNLPNLEFLNLTANPLNVSYLTKELFMQRESLRNLILNKTSIPWCTVEKLLTQMPRLTEIHLSLNNYTSVELEGVYPSITIVHCNANLMTDWNDFVKFGKVFPSLQTLIMAENKICSITSPQEEIETTFSSLEVLNVSKTAINDWLELQKLDFFPKLTNMRLKGIPLLESYSEKQRRQLVVATLSKVSQLNGSVVMPSEREDAERACIRYYMDKNKKPTRYYELQEKYGKIDPLAEVSLTPPKEALVCVKHEDQVQNVKINLKQTVLELKRQLQHIPGVPPSKFRVLYVDVGTAHGPEEMKYPSKNVWTYNIRDGDELLIYRKH